MKRNTKVRIKESGRTGTVIEDSKPADVVKVEYDDEVVTHDFNADELEVID